MIRHIEQSVLSEKIADVDKTIITKKISEKELIAQYVESNNPYDLTDSANSLFK